GAAHGRLSARRRCCRPRCTLRAPRAGQASGADHLLSGAAARGRHVRDRRFVRGAGGARSQPRAARGHQPEGDGRCRVHSRGAPGRTGYAVGLDVPASVLALLADLTAAGYAVGDVPRTSRALLDALSAGETDAALSLDTYARLLAEVPADVATRIHAAWGEPA